MVVWNARGIKEEQKKLEVVNVFKNGRFYLVGLCKTNMKGKKQIM